MYKLKRYKLWTHKKLLKNGYQNIYLSIIWSCQPKGVGSHLVYDSHRKLLQDLVEQVRYLLHKFSTTVTKVYKYQGPPYVVFQILRFRKNPDFAHFQGFQGAFMGISAWVPTLKSIYFDCGRLKSQFLREILKKARNPDFR